MFDPRFASLLREQRAEQLLTRSLEFGAPYSTAFAEDVYVRMAERLRGRAWTRESLLSDVNVILLYVEREDSQVVLDYLGTETLPISLRMPCGRSDTPRQRRTLANKLVQDARRAIRLGKQMLFMINEEVTNRDNKTCLLLPPKTFGRNAKKVAKVVHDTAGRRHSISKFADRLKGMQLPLSGPYYRGAGGVVFKAPSKGGPRHGMAPDWKQGHPSRCVIGGRLRFGAPYDPRFHYDCQLPRAHRREFPGCHEAAALPTGRAHANVAPNDAVR